ncbi:hypothetical protein BEP19_13470 [Ammoniphilus oxalaticus]|uniref:Glycosyltransferase RgtA/B/C/D-like domain-containing protein n=2 Tax=Ammoniphilus oxalaticus TaxID=66863 RepID=A0A419SF79_9BACL|nr:hypothetical protein BEP19_13470 [Ammoniphilus oxalaticus]
MRFIRFGFWALLALNFMIRGWLVFNIDTEPVSDFVRYYQAAISLSEGNGYVMFDRKTAFQGVGYPGFLAVFFAIFGPSLLLAKILNWLLSLGAAFLFLFLAKRMVSEKVALLATLVYLYLPKEMFYVNVLGSEHLFNFLLLAFFACYVLSWPKANAVKSADDEQERKRSRRSRRRSGDSSGNEAKRGMFAQREGREWLWLIPAGVILGVMSLVKPLSPVFGVILFLAEIGRFVAPSFAKLKEARGGVWKGIARTALVAAVSIAVIAPWSIRNYFVFNAFVPLTTNSGYVLYINNNDDATGMWMDPYSIPGSPMANSYYPETDPRFEVETDAAMKKIAWGWIQDNPGRFMQLTLYRFYENFYRNWDWKWAVEGQHDVVSEHTRETIQRWSVVSHAMVASAFFIGVIPMVTGLVSTARRYWRRKEENAEGLGLAAWEPRLLLIAFSLPACVITVVTVIFEGNARYSFPCHPVFALYTAIAISLLWRAARDDSGGGDRDGQGAGSAGAE